MVIVDHNPSLPPYDNLCSTCLSTGRWPGALSWPSASKLNLMANELYDEFSLNLKHKSWRFVSVVKGKHFDTGRGFKRMLISEPSAFSLPEFDKKLKASFSADAWPRSLEPGFELAREIYLSAAGENRDSVDSSGLLRAYYQVGIKLAKVSWALLLFGAALQYVRICVVQYVSAWAHC